jgi:hypothetical protein
MKYKIVCARNYIEQEAAEEVEAWVNRAIEEGFCPVGNLVLAFSGRTWFVAQAMEKLQGAGVQHADNAMGGVE